MNGLLTVREVMDILKVSRETLYKWLRKGELPSCRVGRSYRVQNTDLEKFIRRTKGGK